MGGLCYSRPSLLERSGRISDVNRPLNHTRLNPDQPIRSRRNKVVERSEVSDGMIGMIQPLLKDALFGKRPTIPGFAPYRLRAQSNGAYLDFAVLAADGRVVSGTVNGDLLEVQIEAGLEDHPDAKAWLVDFERCVAWAWIDMKNGVRAGPTKPPQRPVKPSRERALFDLPPKPAEAE